MFQLPPLSTFIDHELRVHSTYPCPFWDGFASCAMNNGSIVKYVHEFMSKNKEKNGKACMFFTKQSDEPIPFPLELQSLAQNVSARLIGLRLAGHENHQNPPGVIFSPQSDMFFDTPIWDYFAPKRVAWENRIPCAFWRGGVSGHTPLRLEVVDACCKIPNTDVKFAVGSHKTHNVNPTTKPTWFAQNASVDEFCKYKATLHVDGNSISASCTWIFASGCVPIMITRHDWWFKKWLVPWKNYIPVKADLSDLAEHIQWIWDNDDKAKQIAESALKLARDILSPEHQRDYLTSELCRIVE